MFLQLLLWGGDAGGAGRDLHVRHAVRGGAALRAHRQPRHRLRLHASLLQTAALLGLRGAFRHFCFSSLILII
jgi:hypothetical protein